MERVYDNSIFDNPIHYDDGTLGFDWGSIIGAGISTGLPLGVGLLQGQQGGQCHAPAGCFQCKMTGQGDIAGCLDAMWSEFTQTRSQGNASQTLALATQMLAAVSNPSLFSQSDAYVTNSKRGLQENIALAQAAGGTLAQATIDPTTGQVVITPQTGGTSTNTLLVFGGLGLLAFLLLKN